MRTMIILKKIADDDYTETKFCEFVNSHIEPESIIKKQNVDTLKNDPVYKKLYKNYRTAKRLMEEYINLEA